jgi:hypothetical protein
VSCTMQPVMLVINLPCIVLSSCMQYELCDVYIEVMKPLMALDESDPQNVST